MYRTKKLLVNEMDGGKGGDSEEFVYLRQGGVKAVCLGGGSK